MCGNIGKDQTMNAPYKLCDDCGAHLDAGEPCDCKRKAAAADRGTAKTARVVPQEAAHYGAQRERDRLGGCFTSPSGPLRGVPRRYC